MNCPGVFFKSARLPAAAALFLALAVPAAAAAHFPLRHLAVRDFVDLSGSWHFRRDEADTGTAAGWFEAATDLADWSRAPVPGVWEMAPGEVEPSVFVGRGWYRRTVTVPGHWDGSLQLWFLGAMHVTDVWVDGRYLGVHRGGFTPFHFDLPRQVGPGDRVTVVARVDNTLSAETVPRDGGGWLSYGGLYRAVYLVSRPAARVSDPAVSVGLDGDTAHLAVSGYFRNGSAAVFDRPLRATLSAGGREVARATVALRLDPGGQVPLDLALAVARPRLWSPDDPFLHELRLAWGETDEVRLRVGLREVRVADGRFLLNGRPFWLQGFGQHEDQLGYGPAIPRSARRAELLLMKEEFQANAIRAGHYPNHPDLYDLADELGLLVFTEIPAWQIRPAVLESAECWEQWLAPQLTAMVRHLRHHPSVAFWGLSNEIYGTHDYFRRARELVLSLDATRPVTAVFASTRDMEAAPHVDFWARNFHYGWYHSREVYALRENLSQALAGARGMPIWVSEVGGLAQRGRLTGGYGDQSRGSETYLDLILRFGLQYSPTASDQVAGVSVWTLNDFHRPRRDHVRNHHGILDLEGRPKLAAWTVRNLFTGDLRAYVCERHAFVPAGGTWRAEVRFFNPGRARWPEVSARWAVLRGTSVLAQGESAFAVDGDRAGTVEEIRWRPPADAPAGLYAFLVEFRDEQGRRLHTGNAYFDVGEHSQPGVLEVAGRPGDFHLDLAGLSLPVYPVTGLLMPLPAGSHRLVFRSGDGRRLERTVNIASGERTRLELEGR